jgi:hypothetical protein
MSAIVCVGIVFVGVANETLHEETTGHAATADEARRKNYQGVSVCSIPHGTINAALTYTGTSA